MNTLTKVAIGRPFFRSPYLLIALSLACVAFLPKVQAVVPPPDGGYPGFNTAEGQKALFSLTSGTAIQRLAGFRSLAIRRAASIRLPARERSCSTMATIIRRLAWPPF